MFCLYFVKFIQVSSCTFNKFQTMSGMGLKSWSKDLLRIYYTLGEKLVYTGKKFLVRHISSSTYKNKCLLCHHSVKETCECIKYLLQTSRMVLWLPWNLTLEVKLSFSLKNSWFLDKMYFIFVKIYHKLFKI